MALCPHCSNEIDDGARFCGVCGRPITPTAGAAGVLVVSHGGDASGCPHWFGGAAGAAIGGG